MTEVDKNVAWFVPRMQWRDWGLVFFVLVFTFFIRAFNLSVPDERCFDEIYYGPASLTYLNGSQDSNTVHPPLGKIEIAAGVLACYELDQLLGGRLGLNESVQLRTSSMVCGVLLVWFTYLLAYRISRGNSSLALLAMFLVSVDFMAMSLSRICMLDMMLALWVLIGAYCAWRYLEESWNASSLRWQYAIMAALAFGCATACKWSGLFGAFGAFWAMYFYGSVGRWEPLPDPQEEEIGVPTPAPEMWKRYTWFMKAKHYLRVGLGFMGWGTNAEKDSDNSRGSKHSHKGISYKGKSVGSPEEKAKPEKKQPTKQWPEIKRFIRSSWGRLGALVLIFSLSISLVYCLSYLPLLSLQSWSIADTFKLVSGYIDTMVNFRYDPSQFKHTYLSYFWSWPLVLRPVWMYYQHADGSSVVVGTVCIGSVVFWWTSFMYMCEMAWNGFKLRDRSLGFIAWLWVPQWLLWAASTTGGFIFYMLPGVPFLALATGFIVDDWIKSGSKSMAIIYIAVISLFFMAYYPFLAGAEVSMTYFDKLFPIWVGSWR